MATGGEKSQKSIQDWLARERSPFFSGETTLGSLTADDRGALARTEC